MIGNFSETLFWFECVDGLTGLLRWFWFECMVVVRVCCMSSYMLTILRVNTTTLQLHVVVTWQVDSSVVSEFQRGTEVKIRVGSSWFHHSRSRSSFAHKTTASSFYNHRRRSFPWFFNACNIFVDKRNHYPFVLQSQRKNLSFVLQRAKPQVHLGSICVTEEPRLDIASAPPLRFWQSNRGWTPFLWQSFGIPRTRGLCHDHHCTYKVFNPVQLSV